MSRLRLRDKSERPTFTQFGGRGASRVTLRGQRWEEERGKGVHREAGDESRGPENLGIRNPENQTLRAGPGS